MSFLKRLAVALAACVVLAGCSAGNSESAGQSAESLTQSSKSVTQGGAESAPESVVDTAKEMPVVNIQTKNTDSLDFVTKPVTRLVAERIATWTPNYRMPPEPYYEDCTVSVTDGGKTVLEPTNASVKVRGNWTTSYNKKPLRIKFETKQNMAGLNGGNEYKNWLLLAEYKDFSMLRNRTAFQLAEDILGSDGYYSSDSRLVEVNINGEYWGVYLLAEYQQINGGRVDITETEKDYIGTDIGYFLEYDGYYYAEAPLQSFKVNYHNDAPLASCDGSGRTATPTAGGKNIVGVTIKSDIYSQAQHDFIERFVNNVYNIMYEAAYNDKAFVMSEDYSAISEASDITPREAVERVVDVRSLVDSYIMAELTCDADIYWSSFFMDADFGSHGEKKLRFEAPWDFDSAFGNKDRCADGSGFYAGNIIFDVDGNFEEMINPWLMVLVNEEWFNDLVKQRWSEIADSGAFERAYELINSETESYSAAFDKNYQKWDNIKHNDAANELSWQAKQCRSQRDAAEYLERWLRSRVEFLNSQWLN